jgi:predicted nucleic acid-binding protein
MLDTNIFDLILADEHGRLRAGLEDSRRIAPYICEVQLVELAGVEDEARRAALLELARGLCRVVSSPDAVADAAALGAAKHARDAAILAAAADRCDCFVTQDARLREQARRHGVTALSFAEFAARAELG